VRKKFRTQAVTAGVTVALALAASLGMNKALASDQHQQPVAEDADDDLLSNVEELALGYQPFRGDQNRNEIPDGAELAKRCAEIINLLPRNGLPGANQIYRICHELDGLERCDVCSEWIHMGGCCIINPKLGLRYPDPHDPLDPQFLPDLAMHYMGHGSFEYSGDVHGRGRLDVPLLLKALEMPRQCGHLGTIYLPGDHNRDCKENLADFAEFADKWLRCTDPNDGQCD